MIYVTFCKIGSRIIKIHRFYKVLSIDFSDAVYENQIQKQNQNENQNENENRNWLTRLNLRLQNENVSVFLQQAY